MTISQKIIVCPNCAQPSLADWKYCPKCGTFLSDKGENRPVRKAGRKWCNHCKRNRNSNLDVYDSKELYRIETIFCHVCGYKLEETEDSRHIYEKNPTCPTCGSHSRKLEFMNVTLTGRPPELMQVFQCTNRWCEMAVPYPNESTKWRTEFIVTEGEKHLVRPSASEFD
jgi:hypothetical protein